MFNVTPLLNEVAFKDIGKGSLNSAWLIVICVMAGALIIAPVIACVILSKTKRNKAITTKDITYGAACLAFSYALSFIGIKLPQGGTITPASILPIAIYAYYFGFLKGSVTVTAYMLLQFLQDPYIVHPMSAVLDYALPYMALLFFGVFSYSKKRYDNAVKNNRPTIAAHYTFFIGGALYVAIRYVSHVLSGVIFFAEYATGPVWIYSLTYNSFCIIDCVIALVAAAGLFCSKTFNRFMASSANTLQNADTAAENDK